MKKAITLSILLIAVSFVSAQTVTVSEKGFYINDVAISKTWSFDDLKKALGEPEHSTGVAGMINRVHYYEMKGIVFWESIKDNNPTGEINEIQIFYSRVRESDRSYKTKGLFSGSTTLDNLNISKSTTAKDVKKGLKTWTSQECYFKNGYKYSNGIVVINFVFNTEENTLLYILIDPAKV